MSGGLHFWLQGQWQPCGWQSLPVDGPAFCRFKAPSSNQTSLPRVSSSLSRTFLNDSSILLQSLFDVKILLRIYWTSQIPWLTSAHVQIHAKCGTDFPSLHSPSRSPLCTPENVQATKGLNTQKASDSYNFPDLFVFFKTERDFHYFFILSCSLFLIFSFSVKEKRRKAEGRGAFLALSLLSPHRHHCSQSLLCGTRPGRRGFAHSERREGWPR